MLERLKTLPLTMVLTILIWMYAEAQTTNPLSGLFGPPMVPQTQPATERTETLRVPQVPVWVAGPPEMLAGSRAEVTPGAVDVTVVGPAGEIERIRTTIN